MRMEGGAHTNLGAVRAEVRIAELAQTYDAVEDVREVLPVMPSWYSGSLHGFLVGH